MSNILARGAEAILTKKNNSVIKTRPVKGYRVELIDTKLRKLRTRHEVKLLKKLEEIGVPCPKVLDSSQTNMTIEMSFIDGEVLKDVLNNNLNLAKEMGRLVGKMHKHNIIHADLTTSNMLVSKNKVHVIDLGLSYISLKLEDKAVDLHVLDRALETKHYAVYPKCFNLVLEGYKETNPNFEEVLERLEVVRNRGRNKKK